MSIRNIMNFLVIVCGLFCFCLLAVNAKKAFDVIIATTPSPTIVVSSGSSFYVPAEHKKVTLFGYDKCSTNNDLFFDNASSENSCIILDKEKISLMVLTEGNKIPKKEVWTLKNNYLYNEKGNVLARLPTSL